MNVLEPIMEGEVDASTTLKVIDEATGIPDQALTHTDFALWYRRTVEPGSTPLALVTAITEVTLASLTTAHTAYGIRHIEDGCYRVDLHDDMVATGARGILIGATISGKIVIPSYHPIIKFDIGGDDGEKLSHSVGIFGQTSGTPTTTACNTNLSGYADDELINGTIVFADGQRAAITDYANTSGVVTFSDGVATAPAASLNFVVV